MTNYITSDQLTEAITAVTRDIRETEHRLRTEFTSAMWHEGGRIDKHLESQDETLKWINRWALGALVTVICALIYLVR